MSIQPFAISALCLASLTAFAAPPAKDQALLDKGKAAFTANCAACHGEKGDGTGPAAVALNPKPRNYATDTFKQGEKVEDVFKTITEGVKGTQMVAFNYLPEVDRWAIAYWVLDLKAKGMAALPPSAKDAGAAPAHVLGDRLIPVLGIGEHRVDVEHHAAKIE
jgi:mono/diheme cytochrome c family protein